MNVVSKTLEWDGLGHLNLVRTERGYRVKSRIEPKGRGADVHGDGWHATPEEALRAFGLDPTGDARVLIESVNAKSAPGWEGE